MENHNRLKLPRSIIVLNCSSVKERAETDRPNILRTKPRKSIVLSHRVLLTEIIKDYFLDKIQYLRWLEQRRCSVGIYHSLENCLSKLCFHVIASLRWSNIEANSRRDWHSLILMHFPLPIRSVPMLRMADFTASSWP